jgi:hypothetical protein
LACTWKESIIALVDCSAPRTFRARGHDCIKGRPITTDNKEITRAVFEELWNGRKFHLIDELIAADYVHHDPQAANGAARGREEYTQFVHLYVDAFPDLGLTVDDEIASGDTVIIGWTATGTHK